MSAPHRERPRDYGTADKRDELAPPHVEHGFSPSLAVRWRSLGAFSLLPARTATTSFGVTPTLFGGQFANLARMQDGWFAKQIRFSEFCVGSVTAATISCGSSSTSKISYEFKFCDALVSVAA
jgi:hypothetical protein